MVIGGRLKELNGAIIALVDFYRWRLDRLSCKDAIGELSWEVEL